MRICSYEYSKYAHPHRALVTETPCYVVLVRVETTVRGRRGGALAPWRACSPGRRERARTMVGSTTAARRERALVVLLSFLSLHVSV